MNNDKHIGFISFFCHVFAVFGIFFHHKTSFLCQLVPTKREHKKAPSGEKNLHPSTPSVQSYGNKLRGKRMKKGGCTSENSTNDWRLLHSDCTFAALSVQFFRLMVRCRSKPCADGDYISTIIIYTFYS